MIALAALFLSSPALAATSVTEFERTTFTNNTSASDAARYQFVVMGDGSGPASQASTANMISSIHRSDPGTHVLLYKEFVASPGDPTGIQGCVDWNSSLPYGGIPLSWFLLSPSGTPLYNTHYADYELDPGNPQVQQACASDAIYYAKRGGYDGVYWDSISTSEFWANLTPQTCSSASCSSNAAWDAAMASYVTNISAAVHAQGLLSIGNIAGGAVGWCCNGGPAYWQALQRDGLDGASEESFTSGTNHLPVPIAQWKQALANEAWNEANGKYFLANADVGNSQALNVYGLATVLLAAQGHSGWDTSSGNYYSGEYWFPEYNTALSLGGPLGPYAAQANGLYVRKFQNGAVVVNPTTGTIADPRYGTVGAHTGLILNSGQVSSRAAAALAAGVASRSAAVGHAHQRAKRNHRAKRHHRRRKGRAHRRRRWRRHSARVRLGAR